MPQRAARCTKEPGNEEIPNLSWGWLRIDLAGSSYFSNLSADFDRAQLVEGFTLPERRDGWRGEILGRENGALIVEDGRCDATTSIEPNSAGYWYVQTPAEILIVSESRPASRGEVRRRRIFMGSGRRHPDPERWVPTGYGHSIGWYEDGGLVVETVGMTSDFVTGGGYRTPETRLTERYHLWPDN